MIRKLKILYYKWVKRACPHICKFCKVRYLCEPYFEEELLETFEQFRK